MEITHEHLVNYDVYFSFDSAFDNDTKKKQEFITSFSFGKLTDKKPVFTSGRRQFAAIETNTSLIAGRIVTFALEEDNGTPLPYLLDFVNKSIFDDSSSMYYQSVDEIEIPVNLFFFNKVTGKTFSFNDIVFTNVSSEKDVTSGKVLYVIDYFCSTLTPSPKSSLVDKKTNIETGVSSEDKKEKTNTTEEEKKNIVVVSSAGELLLNDVGNDKDNYHLFKTEMSPGGVKLLFNIPNTLLSLNSSFHSFEITTTISENNKEKKLTFVFPALVLPHEKIEELKPESFVSEENIVKFAERESIKKYRIAYIESKLKEISRYIDSDKVDLKIVVGDEDKFYFSDSLPPVSSVAGRGLVVVPVLNFEPTQVYNFFSEIPFSGRDFYTLESFGSTVYFGYYNVKIDDKDFFVSEQAIQFNSRINDKNLFVLQKFQAASQEVLFNNLPGDKITFKAGDFLSEYSLVKDTYVFIDKTKNKLEDIVKLGLLPNISSNLTGVAGSYDEKTELSSGSKLYIKPDLNSFALEVLAPITSYYQLAKNESFAVVQFLCFVFFTPSSNTYFEGEKVFYKGVECSLVLKVAKANSSNVVVSVQSTSETASSVMSGSSIFVLDKTFKDDKNNDCYVSISTSNEVYYFLKSDFSDYSAGDIVLKTEKLTVTYATKKASSGGSDNKPEDKNVYPGSVKDLFDSYFKKRFKTYKLKRPVPLLSDMSQDFTDCSALTWAYFVKKYGASEFKGSYPDTKAFRDSYLLAPPLAIFAPNSKGSLNEKEVNSFSFREEDVIVFVSDKPLVERDKKSGKVIYVKAERHIGIVSIKDGVNYFCDISSTTGQVLTKELYPRIDSTTKSYRTGKKQELISCYVYRHKKLVYDTKK